MNIVAFLVIWLLTTVNAETIVIPLHDETIQGGIEMAEDGDTVFVAPGEYVENINFDGKAITVAGIPGMTTIDGNQEGPCVRFNSGEDAFSILLGFTLINGTGVNGRGGGILIERATPVIAFNTLTDNSADNGGAVAIIGAGGFIPTNLYRNLMYNNSAENRGGAVYIGAITPALITNNTIINNESGSEGGGVCSDNGVGVFLTNNIVALNTSGRGGAIYRNGILAPPVSVLYCDVWENEGGNYGRVNAGNGTISEDPQFVDVEANNYFLSEDSPCIDAGDPNGLPDLDGSRADIGSLPAMDLPQYDPLTVDPAILDFGSIDAGSDTMMTITLTNPNDVDITAISQMMSLVNDFEPIERTIMVESEGEAELSIVFHPTEAGVFEDSLIMFAYHEIELADTIVIPYPAGISTVLLRGRADIAGIDYPANPNPVEHRLLRCYPNPFNSTLSINLNMLIEERGSLSISDELGRKVAKLFDGSFDRGINRFQWTPNGLPAGLYSVQYSANQETITTKVVYLK